MNPEKLRAKIYQLLASQKLAVLSTSDKGRPYASLVAFCFSPDLRLLYFATPRATRKYANLMGQPKIAFLIDSRSNSEDDFHEASAVTVLGRCVELGNDKKNTAAGIYLQRHPYLKEFIQAPTTAFFTVEVEKYIHVSRFQHVVEYEVADAADTTP